MQKIKFTYSSVLILLVSFCFSALLNAVYSGCFLSVSLFLSLLYLGLNPLISCLSFILSFLVDFEIKRLFLAVITSIIISPIFIILKKKNVKVGGKILPISLLSVCPFIIVSTPENFILNLIHGAISVLLTLIFISSSRVVFIKRLKYKSLKDELICLAIFSILLGVGFINLLGFNLYRATAIFIILVSLYVFGGGNATITSIILAVAPSILGLSFTYFASLSAIALVSSIFSPKSKFLSAIFAILIDLLFCVVLKVYGAFFYLDILYSVIPCAIFLFLPIKLFDKLKSDAISLKEKLLPKYAINRNRLAISYKLYDVAGVFSQMKQGFKNLKGGVSCDDELFGRISDEIISNACENCPQYDRCKQKGMPYREELIKIISVGVAKGRISLIDLTKRFADNCGYLNSIVFEVNELINKYLEKVKEINELNSGKELITMQSEGVAGVLKNLAFDFSKNLSFLNDLEKKISTELLKRGVPHREVLVLSEDDDIEINVVLQASELNTNEIVNAISLIMDKKMTIVSKSSLSINLVAITLKKAPSLDAGFGLSSRKKNGSSKSGDTHSLIKIDEGKFLIALSDGMGSGKQANDTSTTAISLIESFYKAGLESSVILSMVNKVLALNTDDSFSAIDICAVNLFNKNCDFIKIGSPNSYIITDECIRIVEGSSLPLGILDDLKPTGVSFGVDEGATLLLVTDGISDSFGSSTDMLEYLKTLSSLNPQKLSEALLNKALELENDCPKDDMTALAVRIFKKAS